MAGLQYDPAGYRGYIQYSHEKHLLVEGRDDKRVFALLLDEFFGQMVQGTGSKRDNIKIDSAEHLVDFGIPIGNREKVEMICDSVSTLPYADRLVGFVDREFREFERDPSIDDRIGRHKVTGRLVWSRGHSIENYYFDFDTLRQPLRTFSVIDYFRDVFELFERIFEQTIRLACAASLAGDELQRLKPIKSSADRDIFDIAFSGSEVTLTIKLNAWKACLLNKQRLSEGTADGILEHFRLWYDRVKEADFRIVRWMCHGHIGLAFIWAAYSRCVCEVCQRAGRSNPETEARRILKAEESVRFNTCAEVWARRALGNQSEYPVEVLKLLGLSISNH
jgi:hypothetical protein